VRDSGFDGEKVKIILDNADIEKIIKEWVANSYGDDCEVELACTFGEGGKLKDIEAGVTIPEDG
jgi:hypothetical protein